MLGLVSAIQSLLQFYPTLGVKSCLPFLKKDVVQNNLRALFNGLKCNVLSHRGELVAGMSKVQSEKRIPLC